MCPPPSVPWIYGGLMYGLQMYGLWMYGLQRCMVYRCKLCAPIHPLGVTTPSLGTNWCQLADESKAQQISLSLFASRILFFF